MLRVVIAMSVMVLSVLAVTGCVRRAEASTLTPLGIAADGSTILNGVERSFFIKPEITKLTAGKITFRFKNLDVVTHEMLVVHAQGLSFGLPYDFSISRVIEAQMDKPGETGDIPPGTTGEVTLDLPPGRYVLICNLVGHYQAGMHTLIDLAPAK
jgi:uncharacterized cupredoxin-like copper-binding protein